MKKISGRYKFVFVDLKKNKTIPVFSNPKTASFLSFKQQQQKGTDLFLIDQYIFRSFQNEESLRLHVKALGYQIPDTYVPRITYQYNGKTCYLEPVYQNHQLHDLGLICMYYHEKISHYYAQKQISKEEVRNKIMLAIKKEETWRAFYKQLLEQIHDRNFYLFLKSEQLIGRRTLEFIYEYLQNENGKSLEEQQSYEEIKQELFVTFTTYKSIRDVIVASIKYRKSLEKTLFEEHKNSTDTTQTIDFLVPWHQKTIRRLTELQIYHLESHEYFCQLSDLEKVDFVNRLLVDEKRLIK